MTLQEILASILNPNGMQQQNQLSMAGAAPPVPLISGAPVRVGDHADPALLRQARQGLIQPPQRPQQAQPQPATPPQLRQGAPAPESAPQRAPEANGGGFGGIGDFLQNIIAPQSAKKNVTVGWLQKQGLDQGPATLLAGNKPALQQYLLSRSQGQKPIEVNGRLVDPNTYEVLADFSDKSGSGRRTTTIDGKLVDTDTGQVIGDYGKAEARTRDLTPDEVAKRGLPPGTYQEDADGNLKVVGSVREQDAGFKNEIELRREYDTLPEVKDYKVVRSNYERIRQGVHLGTGAGDAAVVFGYMKMLDPTSVVREGEQASARNAAGVPEGLRGMYNNIIGGGQLSAEARQQILGAAEKVYGESSANIEDVNKRYGGYAEAWKLDPSRIVAPTEQYDPLAPPAANGGGLPLPPPPSLAPGTVGGPGAVTPGGKRVLQNMGNPAPIVDWKDYFGKKAR